MGLIRSVSPIAAVLVALAAGGCAGAMAAHALTVLGWWSGSASWWVPALVASAAAVAVTQLLTRQVAAGPGRSKFAASGVPDDVLLAAVVEASTEFIWATDADHRFTLFLAGDGRPDALLSSWVGNTRWGLADADLDAPVWRAHLADLDARRPFRDFAYSLDVDGRLEYRTTSGVPMFASDGTFVGYCGTASNVTDLARTHQSLRRYQNAVAATDDLVCVIDRDGIYQLANPAYAKAVGRTVEHIVGHTVADVLSPAWYADDVRPFLDSCFAGHGAANHHWVDLQGSGRRYIETHWVPMHEDGEIVAAVCMIRDRTEEQMQEERLRQAQKMEAVGLLTGGIAHDFNNVLGSMLGYAQLLSMRPQLAHDPDARRHASAIREAGERATRLVRQLLVFSRSDARDVRPVDVSEFIAGELNLIRPGLPSSIDIEVTHDGTAPLEVLADRAQLGQVLMNLCLNARDAVGEAGTLKLGARRVARDAGACASCGEEFAGTFIELSVRDDGRGVADDVRDRMFEPFFTTHGESGGSGMGLAVVHGIVHEHGGHLTVESEAPSGTCFRLYLPVHQGTEGPGRAEGGADEAEHEGRGARVLIVDDETSLVDFVAEFLEMHGFVSSRFSSPVAALAALRDDGARFDALLTDYTMPGMTGLELVASVRALQPGIAVIMWTGYGDRIDEPTATAAGVDRFFVKPVDSADVVASMCELLNKRARDAAAC